MDRQFHLRVFFWPFLCLFSSFKHNQLKYVEPNSSQKFLGIFGFQKTSKLSFDRAESQNFHLRTFLYILMQNLKCYLSIGTNLQKNCLKVLPQTYDLFVYCFLATPLWHFENNCVFTNVIFGRRNLYLFNQRMQLENLL